MLLFLLQPEMMDELKVRVKVESALKCHKSRSDLVENLSICESIFIFHNGILLSCGFYVALREGQDCLIQLFLSYCYYPSIITQLIALLLLPYCNYFTVIALMLLAYCYYPTVIAILSFPYCCYPTAITLLLLPYCNCPTVIALLSLPYCCYPTVITILLIPYCYCHAVINLLL